LRRAWRNNAERYNDFSLESNDYGDKTDAGGQNVNGYVIPPPRREDSADSSEDDYDPEVDRYAMRLEEMHFFGIGSSSWSPSNNSSSSSSNSDDEHGRHRGRRGRKKSNPFNYHRPGGSPLSSKQKVSIALDDLVVMNAV
jgi:hypothetical protein